MATGQVCTSSVQPNADVFRPSRPRLATWLRPREQSRFDAIGVGTLALQHFNSFRQVRESVGGGDVDAVVLSTALVGQGHVREIRAAIEGFPEVDYLGLVFDATDA